jgi:Ca2+-binding EF-hand superfamily protein
MQMTAWSLPCDERAKVRGAFLELDTQHKGVIQLRDLKRILEERFQTPDSEAMMIVDAFQAIDTDKDGEVHYSDFLAAMMFSPRLAPTDKTIEDTFRRFDMRGKGTVGKSDLCQVLGDSALAHEAFAEVQQGSAQKIASVELARYIREEKASSQTRPEHCSSAEERDRVGVEYGYIRVGCLPFWRHEQRTAYGGA